MKYLLLILAVALSADCFSQVAIRVLSDVGATISVTPPACIRNTTLVNVIYNAVPDANGRIKIAVYPLPNTATYDNLLF